jgi:1-deoxy-D-xylulose 5-phosphate reductoisomerase
MKMRMKPSLFFAILLAVFLSSCQTGTQPAATLPAESMKGFELYSWQEGSQWKFSLLTGTNREKTLDEIQSTSTALNGVEGLRSTLGAISPGQTITWSAKEPLSFPPEEILQQVEQICRDEGLTCNIAR